VFRQIRTLISEWLDGLTNDCQALDRDQILARLSAGEPLDLYKPDEIWLNEAAFNPSLLQLQVVCRIAEPHYTTRSIGHVAAEQLIRCYSQTCFLLGILLTEAGSESFGATTKSENFFYAGTEARYRRPEPTGHPITFTLALDKVVKLGDSAAFYFKIVSGSMTGKVMCFYAPGGSSQELPATLYDQLYFVWKSAWAELPKFKLNCLRLVARLLKPRTRPLPTPTTA
jgi:hypothetical protein